VLFYTRRPDGDVEYPKLNGVLKIADWDWILGTGVFLDDIDATFWKRVWQFLGIEDKFTGSQQELIDQVILLRSIRSLFNWLVI
jgi:signal transduction histidine kinase